MPQTTRKWTYRDPLVTVTYPAGTDAEDMPAKRRKAAEDAGVFEAPKETENGERLPAARASGRAGKAESK